MHAETISSACLFLISELGKTDVVADFYLVGGTALALQIGHRVSVDLDFFSPQEFDLDYTLAKLGKHFKLDSIRLNRTNVLYRLNGIKTEFVYYAYAPSKPLLEWNGIKLLDAEDIGLFKLLALLGRHNKKDIVDLYFIDKEVLPLEELFIRLTKQFERGDVNLFKQLELLFDDETINNTEMPQMLKPFDFETGYEEVKGKIRKAIGDYFRINK